MPEIEIIDSKYDKWVNTKRNTDCISCNKDLSSGVEYYLVNPPGGYGLMEVRLCLGCLHKPENKGFFERLKKNNVLEERDLE